MFEYTNTQLWFLVSCMLVLCEIGTPGLFYLLSLACGSLIAAGVTWHGYDLITQIGSLLVGSFISLLFLKLWVKKTNSHTKSATNTDALTNKKAIVVRINNSYNEYTVRLDGSLWMAQTLEESHFKVGQSVVVKSIKGIKLVIESEK